MRRDVVVGGRPRAVARRADADPDEGALGAIARPLAALVARAELAAQLAAMAASVDRLAARIRAAREGLEGTAG